MPFFSRPDLSNEQFKQLSGSTLTLSGTTQISSIGGFEFQDKVSGEYIPIVISGASNNYVLTYDDSTCVIKLKESTASGATGVYPYPDKVTCTVGGISGGTCLYNMQVVDILQEILVPTIEPSIVSAPFSLFCTSPSVPSILEVGCQITLTGCIYCFNRGCVCPAYGCPSVADGYRVGGVTCYTYNCWGEFCDCASTSMSFGTHIIVPSTNQIGGYVCYSQGCCVYKSDCVTPSSINSQCPIGSTSACSYPTIRTICISGIYPYYFGKVCSNGAPAGSNRPTDACIKTIITGGTVGVGCTCNKVVAGSSGTISVNFGSTSDDYLWFAIPSGSTSKTCWYVDALNKGIIGGVVSPGGNLFPTQTSVTGIKSNLSCWSGQTYQFYVSNYQTATCALMELRNS